MNKKPFSKAYKKEDISVIWTPDLCIHSKVCVSKLPMVYRPDERPWIQPEYATKDEIIEQVSACPSGALRLKNSNAAAIEEDDDLNLAPVEVINNGPLLVHNGVAVTLADGSCTKNKNTTAFCRCGASKEKPYCDGSHTHVNFDG